MAFWGGRFILTLVSQDSESVDILATPTPTPAKRADPNRLQLQHRLRLHSPAPVDYLPTDTWSETGNNITINKIYSYRVKYVD